MAHLLSEFEAELGSLAEEVPKPNARVPKTSSKASSSPGKDTVGRKKVDVERAPKERPSSSSSKRSSSKRVSSAPGSLGKGGRESGGRKRRRKEKEVLGDPKKGNRERTTRSGTRRRSSSSNKEKDEDRRAAGGTASKSSGVARKRQGGGVKEKPSSSRGEKSASETAVAPAVAEDSLAIVPVPEPVLSESQRRSREVLRSVKKASRANTKRQRGTDKPLQQKEKEKPLSAMTLKEIIRQSVEADRTDNRKRPRPSKKQNQGGGQGQSQSQGQGQGQGQGDTGGDDVGRKGAASAEGRSGGSVGAGPSKTGQKAGSIAPQVEVVDGEIVINRQSLSMKAQVEPLMKPERRVEESGNKLSAFSYSGYLAPEKWTKEDTTKFYTALEQFGTDFGTIQKFFPKRERKQIKSKFRREEKANPEKIEMALNTHRQMSEEVCVQNLKKLVQMMQDAEQDNA
ncbi:subunit of Bdp1 transcription initiation factor TFIIIB [Chloropicon roscoffensis]|uniref:Subunit of Bdp1 transcription initiation factor TFIIIB n=3 Tax=Chloropicon roscoffensis TaxID=1461544 RepID=A0AAX4P7G9_9CHLO